MKQQILVVQEDDDSWTVLQYPTYLILPTVEQVPDTAVSKGLELGKLLDQVLNLLPADEEDTIAERAVPVWVRWKSYLDAMVDEGMDPGQAGVASGLLAVVDYLEMHLRVQEIKK